jgi:RNA polymerase sigma-70 factor (ECF subfamily)
VFSLSDDGVLPDSDEQRFELLYQESYRPLVRLCRRYVGSGRDAEAIAQEAFMRAWESRDSFSPDRPFWPWVATIARRLCINDSLTRARRDELLPHALPRCTSSAYGDELADAPFSLSDAGRALRRLSPRYRRLLFLRDIEGWSYDEIARFDGATTESVRSSLKRARETFRRVYRDVAGSALGGLGGMLRWVRSLPMPGSSSEIALVAVLSLLAASSGSGPSGAPVAPGGATMALPSMVSAEEPTSASSSDGGGVRHTGTAPRPQRVTEAAGAAIAPPSGSAIDGYDYTFTASPAYDDDRTVYASGRLEQCDMDEVTSCSVLLRSTDGGATWTRLAAQGWDRGTIMLPPAYPADPRVFSASQSSLQVSYDGGATFGLLTPIYGTARMSPRFSAGDERILIGAGSLGQGLTLAMEYRVEKGILAPLDLGLPDGVRALDFAFSPDYAVDRAMLVTAVDISKLLFMTEAGNPPRLFRCDPDGCREVLQIGHAAVTPLIAWSGDGTVLVSDTFSTFHRSLDGGHTFHRLASPDPEEDSAVLGDVKAGDDGRLFLTMFYGHSFATSRLYVSETGGASWRIEQDGPSWLFGDLLALSDGSLVGSLSYDNGGGITYSRDGGRTWTASTD